MQPVWSGGYYEQLLSKKYDFCPGRITALLAILGCNSAIGDLNAGSLSAVYRKLTRHLVDVQKALNDPRFPTPTFHSRSPTFRIDHIFVSEHFKIFGVEVSKTPDARLASDHLPLSVELALSNEKIS